MKRALTRGSARSSADPYLEEHKFFTLVRGGEAPPEDDRWTAFIFAAERDARDLLARHFFDQRVVFVGKTRAKLYAKSSLRVIAETPRSICVFHDAESYELALSADRRIARRSVIATRSAVDALYPTPLAAGLWLHPVEPMLDLGPAGQAAVEDVERRRENVGALFDRAASRARSGDSRTSRPIIVGDLCVGRDSRELAAIARHPEARQVVDYMPNPLSIRRINDDLLRTSGLSFLAPETFAENLHAFRPIYCLEPLSATILRRAGLEVTLIGPIDDRPAPLTPRGLRLRGLLDPERALSDAARARLVNARLRRESTLDHAVVQSEASAIGPRDFLQTLQRLHIGPDDLSIVMEAHDVTLDSAAREKARAGLREAMLDLLTARGARAGVVGELLPNFMEQFGELDDEEGGVMCVAIQSSRSHKGDDAAAHFLQSIGGVQHLRSSDTLDHLGTVFAQDPRALIALSQRLREAERAIAADRLLEKGAERSAKPIELQREIAARQADSDRPTDVTRSDVDKRLAAAASTIVISDKSSAKAILGDMQARLVREIEGAVGESRKQLLTSVAIAQLMQGDYADGAEKLRNLALFGGSTPMRGYLSASHYFGVIEGEIDAVSEIARGDGATEAMQLLLFRLLIFADRADEAYKLLDGAIAERRLREKTAVAAAAEYLAEYGDPSVALSLMERLPPEELAKTRSAMALAMIHSAMGRLDLAEAAVRRGLARNDKQTGLLRYYANILERQENYAEAVVALELLMNRQPNVYAYTERWARAVRIAGLLEDRIGTLHATYRKLDLEGFEARWLASLQAEAGDLYGANKWADAGLEREPTNRSAAAFAVQIKRALADMDGAQALIEAFEGRTTGDPRDLCAISGMWRIAGDNLRAQETSERAIAAYPDDWEAQEVHARALIEQDRPADAMKHAELSIIIRPGRSGPFALGAQAATMAADFEQAERYLSTLAKIDPTDPRAANLSGKLRETQGRYDEAQSEYLRSEGLRRARGESYNLRTCWSLATTSGGCRNYAGMKQATAMFCEALHAALPPDLPVWRGEDLSGKRLLMLTRGGPGDEIRFYNTIFPALMAADAKVDVVGDRRLEEIFSLSFPQARFVKNPWLGRRLLKTQKPVDSQFASRLQPGSLEALRRFSAYIPGGAHRDYDYVCYSDDVLQEFYFNDIERSIHSQWRRPLLLPDGPRRRIREWLDSLPGVKVALSWRGAYFSVNRRVSAFLSADELGPILSVPGVTFIDAHPNPFEGEVDDVLARTGARFERLEGLDMMNDFVGLGWLFREVDALITPGVTQRDIAGAVGGSPIYSFDLLTGVGETWRIDPRDGSDGWQDGIEHFALSQHGSREQVVQAVADALRAHVGRLSASAPADSPKQADLSIGAADLPEETTVDGASDPKTEAEPTQIARAG